MIERWFKYPQVIFDCDSTLSYIEGIDLLAEKSGKIKEVQEMTDAAMDGKIPLEEIYGRRLSLIKPTQEDICQLHKQYQQTEVDDARLVIKMLIENGHEVHIVSGGLLEPVKSFGVSLGVKPDNIHAVTVSYDQLSGQWWQQRQAECQYMDFDRGPLTTSEGKKEIIEKIRAAHPGRSMLIGDGISDLYGAQAVDLFVGYGGVVSREKVKEGAPIFINCQSLLPILAIAGAQPLIKWLCSSDKEIADKMKHLLESSVDFKRIEVKEKLLDYFY